MGVRDCPSALETPTDSDSESLGLTQLTGLAFGSFGFIVGRDARCATLQVK